MREVLEKYLEDEDDMLDMNLTAKCALGHFIPGYQWLCARRGSWL